MTQEIVDRLRFAYAGFARGDFSAWGALPEEFELVTALEMPDAGIYCGPDARRWLAEWVESFERLTLDAAGFTDAGDRVIVEVIQRGWFKQGENAVELRHWAVVTMRGGTMTRAALFLSHDEALADAGLS